MPRKTKKEYEDLIARTRGKLPELQPSEEFDQPPTPERIRRLAEIQCHIQLDILMTLRQIDRKLGEMQFSSGLPDDTSVVYGASVLLADLTTEDKKNDSTSI